jgi:hypothetical protein
VILGHSVYESDNKMENDVKLNGTEGRGTGKRMG